jgi:uncharacterized protein (DUF58 family)
MRTREQEVAPFVNLSEITEIELVILRRMREYTLGEHRSLFHGIGFDFVGLRNWEAGDRFETIDWAQSTLTNFNPMVVRDFEQPSTAGVVVVADHSRSTRCGVTVPHAAGRAHDDRLIAHAVARAIATIGMSAVFFQDSFGLITFHGDFERMQAVRPRIGKGQVIHALDAYQFEHGLEELRMSGSTSQTLAGFLRRTSLVPVVSDFLFEEPAGVLKELAQLGTAHDVFLVMIDAAFAYDLPPVSAGWVEAYDVETGRARLMSRGSVRRMADRVRTWQDEVVDMARDVGLDVLRLDLDETKSDIALTEFAVERRLRKK